MKTRLLATIVMIALGTNVWAQDYEVGKLRAFLNWKEREVPYVISAVTTEDTIDTKFLKFALAQRLKTITSAGVGAVTVKDLVNEIIFPTLGTGALALPAFPMASVPGVGEAFTVIQTVFNVGVYDQVPSDLITGTTILAMAFDYLVSDEVKYNVVEPLAELYEFVGKNARGLAEVHHAYLPTAWFTHLIPWWDIPDIKLLPVWGDAPQATALPVDWMIAEAGFDMAILTLRIAAQTTDADQRSEIYSIYKYAAKRLKLATEASNDISGDDLEYLLRYRTERGVERLVINEKLGEDDPDKLDELYVAKKRLKFFLYDDFDGEFENDGLKRMAKDGNTVGRFGELLAGHMACIYKDTLYASLMSEYLWLEGAERKGEPMDEEQRTRLRKLAVFGENRGPVIVNDRFDDFALTDRERRQGYYQFDLNVCMNRFPNKYLADWRPGQAVVATSQAGYINHLRTRVSEAQRKIQAYGQAILDGDFDLYKVEGFFTK